jgi:hypothetical protein
VLGQGGQRPPDDLIRAFLGRESRGAAFFDDLRQ